MKNGSRTRSLSVNERRSIQRYVRKVLNEELSLLREYYDVDKGLRLRPEIERRLKRGMRGVKRLSHEEFWSRAMKGK